MKKINEIVNYDLQKNTFYKINKQTGEESPSYRNGQKLRSFKPDVTGYHYLIRRSKQKSASPRDPMKLYQQQSFLTEKSYDQPSYYKTIDCGTKHDHKISQPASFCSKESVASSFRESKHLNSDRKNKLLMAGFQNGVSQQKSKDQLNKELFNQTISNYSKYMKERTRENNSPKKDQIPGCEQIRDPVDVLCTTISHFAAKQSDQVPKHNRSLHKPIPSRILPNEYSPKERSSKQRSLFLQFHPEYKAKQLSKGVQMQVQRKKNMLILEQLFIKQNNNATKSIYGDKI